MRAFFYTSQEVAVLGEGVVRAGITEDGAHHGDVGGGLWISFKG